jgi:hypothetical protein
VEEQDDGNWRPKYRQPKGRGALKDQGESATEIARDERWVHEATGIQRI